MSGANAALKPQIKTVDMSDEMMEFSVEVAAFAMNEYMIEAQMANHIKREFDKKYRYGGYTRAGVVLWAACV